jgi:hypothetical protein
MSAPARARLRLRWGTSCIVVGGGRPLREHGSPAPIRSRVVAQDVSRLFAGQNGSHRFDRIKFMVNRWLCAV